jgi:hypothetical protein
MPHRTCVRKCVRLSRSRIVAGFDSNSRSSIRSDVDSKFRPHVENLQAENASKNNRLTELKLPVSGCLYFTFALRFDITL